MILLKITNTVFHDGPYHLSSATAFQLLPAKFSYDCYSSDSIPASLFLVVLEQTVVHILPCQLKYLALLLNT